LSRTFSFFLNGETERRPPKVRCVSAFETEFFQSLFGAPS